jgi:S1-C subfamily serine protease
LKFYDVKQSGIEVQQAKEGVVVKKVHKGKPFAKAGVQEGDRLLALDGTKIDSLDVFRRLVRRNAMANNDIVLTVERPGKGKLNLTVELTD